MTGMADSPPDSLEQNNEKKIPSLHAHEKMTGLPRTTAIRKLKKRKQKCQQLKNLDHNLSWSSIKKREGYKKITADMRKQLLDWICNHPHVVDSPIHRDTLLVMNPETKKKERVGKLLLQVSVQELHNNLVEPVKNSGLECARDAEG